jgi:transcriptional regulator with XRE-family HTH domain
MYEQAYNEPQDLMKMAHKAPEKAINITIGKNIRIRRSLMGFSQSELAKRLGITFQQVQKYEKGGNSVSPAKLVQLSKIFGCGIGELFLEVAPSGHEAAQHMPSRKAIHLINNFEHIGSKEVQKQICDLVRILADKKSS